MANAGGRNRGRHERRPNRLRVGRWLVCTAVAMLVAAAARSGAAADHESVNALVFERAPGSATAATGSGGIVFQGGEEPASRWTVAFRFADLPPERAFTVVVKGRFGEDGSNEADAFTALCAFRSSATGEGGCWDYLLGMRRVGIVQLRLGDEAGTALLQATRAEEAPGAIRSERNRFSPPPTAVSGTPAATPATRTTATDRPATPGSLPIDGAETTPEPE